LKEEALDRTVWGTCFGRGCGLGVGLRNEMYELGKEEKCRYEKITYDW